MKAVVQKKYICNFGLKKRSKLDELEIFSNRKIITDFRNIL